MNPAKIVFHKIRSFFRPINRSGRMDAETNSLDLGSQDDDDDDDFQAKRRHRFFLLKLLLIKN